MSKHQIALFTFTLGKGESIGPVPLRELRLRSLLEAAHLRASLSVLHV